MSADLQEFYSDLLLEHSESPSNSGTLSDPTHSGSGYNPTCGDAVEVQLNVDGDKISDIRFSGKGCAICIASCSTMTECVKGKEVCEIKKLANRFFSELKGEEDVLQSEEREILAPVLGVKRLPSRVRCATLSWQALAKALPLAK